MKVRIECKAVKGDVWATINIKVEGNCKDFYLDTEIKRMGSTFTQLLTYKGVCSDQHRYDLNRSALADNDRPMITRVEELINHLIDSNNHLIDRNNALLKQYPEENIIVNCEG